MTGPPPPISVRAHFERFPATVKGAFVVRGEDKDPHQVIVRAARVEGVAGEAEEPLAMPDVILNVAPHQDVFVPFELSVVELPPGWYELQCDLDVDGAPTTYPGGKRFVVPWPRGTMRRGQVRIGQRLSLGERIVRIEQVDLAGDQLRLALSVEPPDAVDLFSVELGADGASLPLLDVEVDADTGRVRLTAYPARREQRSLTIEVRTGRGRTAGSASLDVALP